MQIPLISKYSGISGQESMCQPVISMISLSSYLFSTFSYF